MNFLQLPLPKLAGQNDIKQRQASSSGMTTNRKEIKAYELLDFSGNIDLAKKVFFLHTMRYLGILNVSLGVILRQGD